MSDSNDQHRQQRQQQEMAEAVGRGMFANDAALIALGIEIVRIAPGAATLRMVVRSDTANAFSICHGGLITTLADSAFAYACNSRNVMTVASALSVDFLAPAQIGDVLTADAAEVSLRGRTGVYDATVRNQRDEPIAVFRGRSHALPSRQTVPDAPPDVRPGAPADVRHDAPPDAQHGALP